MFLDLEALFAIKIFITFKMLHAIFSFKLDPLNFSLYFKKARKPIKIGAKARVKKIKMH